MGYNMTIESIRFEVPTMNHLVLNGVDSAIRPELIKEIKSLSRVGVIDAKEYANTTDSIYVPINSKRIKEAVWGVQEVLDSRHMAYNLVGQYAPDSPKWDGYKELAIDIRLGVEQRTDSIKSLYRTLTEAVKKANQSAWEIGRLLCEQRQALSHNKQGGFNGWLKSEFADWSERSAYNFINLYETYPNLAIIARLDMGLTVLYKLSAPSTPESARAEVQALAEQGEKVTVAQAAEIIASHKVTIPDSLLWLPERLHKAAIHGWFGLTVDHLQALAPLKDLNIANAPMLATITFDKAIDTPTPQALFNRLSTRGDLSADEVAKVVSRMVGMCKPSANEVDCSEFDEADFAELGEAGEVQPSQANFETGTPGYSYKDGGKQVICDATGEVMSLEQFKLIKELAEADKGKAAKPRKSSNGNGSGGHTRTAAQIQGDKIANGYVAQVERGNALTPRQFMVNELGKMDNGALVLLAAAIAKAVGFDDEVFNEAFYIADFVMNEVGGGNN